MIRRPNRREMLVSAGALALAAYSPSAWANTRAKIVIVGGGFGGATCALSLRQFLPEADITLIESQTTYYACPFSNLVLTGHRELSAQAFEYSGLSKVGINVVHQRASDIDPVRQRVRLGDGSLIAYNKLVLSPGIDFRWDTLEGYGEEDSHIFPHAWKAGAQTELLARQLDALEDGEPVIITVPPSPFRCPPGPYERASLIADYLKNRKPKSKLILLDSNDRFSKMPLFLEAWAEHYPDHLEWRSASNDGRIIRANATSKTVDTDFETHKGGVINIIPPQQAGLVARSCGATDQTGWCPINATTFESRLLEDVYVIGDATIAAPMPKSAFSANLQGKLCAISIATSLSGAAMTPTVLANTCYSYTSPAEAVSIVGVYRNDDEHFTSVEDAGGLSPLAASKTVRESEAAQARDWFRQITEETFGV